MLEKNKTHTPDFIISDQSESKIGIAVVGNWTKITLRNISAIENKFSQTLGVNVAFDFGDVGEVDSAGVVEIIRVSNLLLQNRCSVTFINLDETTKRLLIFYRKNFTKKIKIESNSLIVFDTIGLRFIEILHGAVGFLSFIGELFFAILAVIVKPLRFRFKSFIKHIEHSGIRALPIITLTSFLVGLVVAYQASNQLIKFGANIFIVDMSTMSIFRELAPMITAIVVAGRSASSYTAEIGTMKITEEIDAMKTMGFDPYIFLVLPRMLALMLAMPLIIFAADLVGLFGAMLVAKYNMCIAFSEFTNRVQSEVPIKHLYIGLCKAPFFGAIISLIGCYRGFQVSGSTDSIGSYTTKSVVDAIFWIIAFNAVVAMALTKIGI